MVDVSWFSQWNFPPARYVCNFNHLNITMHHAMTINRLYGEKVCSIIIVHQQNGKNTLSSADHTDADVERCVPFWMCHVHLQSCSAITATFWLRVKRLVPFAPACFVSFSKPCSRYFWGVAGCLKLRHPLTRGSGGLPFSYRNCVWQNLAFFLIKIQNSCCFLRKKSLALPSL